MRARELKPQFSQGKHFEFAEGLHNLGKTMESTAGKAVKAGDKKFDAAEELLTGKLKIQDVLKKHPEFAENFPEVVEFANSGVRKASLSGISEKVKQGIRQVEGQDIPDVFHNIFTPALQKDLKKVGYDVSNLRELVDYFHKGTKNYQKFVNTIPARENDARGIGEKVGDALVKRRRMIGKMLDKTWNAIHNLEDKELIKILEGTSTNKKITPEYIKKVQSREYAKARHLVKQLKTAPYLDAVTMIKLGLFDKEENKRKQFASYN